MALSAVFFLSSFFIISASLIVVLIYLPVVGGVTGRISRKMESIAKGIQNTISIYLRIVFFVCICIISVFTAYLLLNSLFININKNSAIALMVVFFLECICLSTLITSFKLQKNEENFQYKRSFLGKVFYFFVGNNLLKLL